MRKLWGILWMLAGFLLVLGGVLLFLNNSQENRGAQDYSHDAMHAISQEFSSVPEATSSDNALPEPVMTETMIDGYGYIGYLMIPDLELELPVMATWDDDRLQLSPCRYSGSTAGEDLVIVAHNYAAHFGRLKEHSVGAPVNFMDMDGRLWQYRVVATEILSAEAVEEMTSGSYDLTLFTCAPNRTHRVTIRCDEILEF